MAADSSFALTSLVLSCAETIDYYGEICDNACPCEEKDGILTVSCENRGSSAFQKSALPARSQSTNSCCLETFESPLSQWVCQLHWGLRFASGEQCNPGHWDRASRAAGFKEDCIWTIINWNFCVMIPSLVWRAWSTYRSITITSVSLNPTPFGKLHLLQVLILNDNLLSSLPNNLFRFVPLTHLDLRGNRLKLLPYVGPLGIWIKSWSYNWRKTPGIGSCELISLVSLVRQHLLLALVGDVVCETPFLGLHGRDLDEVSKQELCPRNLFRTTDEAADAPSTTGYLHTTPAVEFRGHFFPLLFTNPLKPPKGTRQPVSFLQGAPTSRQPLQGPGLWQLMDPASPTRPNLRCLWSVPPRTLQPANLRSGPQRQLPGAQDQHAELQPKPYKPPRKCIWTENYTPWCV